MNYRTILEKAEEYVSKATPPKKRKSPSDFPAKSGVYIIYKNEKVIYIGQAKNLRNRFKNHFSTNPSPKTSTLRRTLIRKYDEVESENTYDWIVDNCRIAYIEIEEEKNPVDICKLVESLLIAYYRLINKDLLNS